MGFGVSNNVRSRVVRECTPELFRQVVRMPIVGQVCASIADAWESLKRGEMSKEDFEEFKSREKKRLPIFTFHATFKNGRRLNADAVPSGLSMYDIDHINDPRGYWEIKNEELKIKNLLHFIVLVHVTPSGEGLRIVFRIPKGMDLAGAQRWMSEQLGDANYDQSVKDLARSSFAVPEDYIIYIDEEKLFSKELQELEEVKGVKANTFSKELKELEGIKGVKADTLLNTNKKLLALTPERSDNSSNSLTPNKNDNSLTPNFKGIPYKDIIKNWFALTGGEPVEGERNDRLHQLASHLRYITDNNEEKLLQIMPRYGLSEEEMKGLIHSACQAKWCSIPKVLRTSIDNAQLTMDNSNKNNCPLSIINCQLNSQLPELPKRLPNAVAHAVFPSLAAHLHRVRFKYIDNVEHEATLMNVLMAGTGAGKDCISEPINRIMKDIRLRDEENLRREREWKNEINSKGATKDKRQRPEGLIIQEIDADMTNPAFVMRTAEADGHFLYTKLNEIDQFDALRGSGKGGQQFQIMCLSFDPKNRYGQTRVGAQSVTEKVTIRFNWNAATTILKGKRYFSKVLTDGPISRINFCTIPEREIGAEMPVYGTYDAGFDEELRPYIENLTRATGLIDCPEAFKLAQKLREENADFARLSQSRVYENLSFRANVIAYLKACVLYVANGCKWDKSIEEFTRWSLQYDMQCKMDFFGDAIERAMNEGEADSQRKRGPRNLLVMLPDEFTFQDVIRLRQNVGLNAEGTRNMLTQWKFRNYITDITDYSYRKLKFRSDGSDIEPNKKA